MNKSIKYTKKTYVSLLICQEFYTNWLCNLIFPRSLNYPCFYDIHNLIKKVKNKSDLLRTVSRRRQKKPFINTKKIYSGKPEFQSKPDYKIMKKEANAVPSVVNITFYSNMFFN